MQDRYLFKAKRKDGREWVFGGLSYCETESYRRLTMKITELDLSVRSYNVLLRAGIDTTEKIKEMTDDDLRQIKHLNEKCLEEIR